MRKFSDKQKLAVEIVTGRTGDADHIMPHSAGGATEVENCQNISHFANQKKSAFEFKPYRWQTEFFEAWEKRQPNKPFTLIAIPGSGKTKAALEVARRWMAAGVDRRILWITSSDNLRTQTQEEARLFGLDLQSRDFGTNFKHGYQGGVTTYHFVANNPALIRKLVSVAPTIIVFDEIHHCGDESHFGRGIREACELAREKLCMSGTPWKTDGQPIPFVSYDGDGFAVGNYRYDYPDALTDAVVRYLRFDHAKGTIVNEITGSQVEVSGDITEEEAEKRLSILLESDGRYVEQQILDAHAKLTELRQRIPDAGALAICIDQSHARRVAAKIYKLTGSQPSIIVSDEEITNDEVGSFRKSTKEWLVAVRKVSEGTDIKRLMVLCYLMLS